MRCTACGAELILTNVAPDDTVAVRGVENHTFICSVCHVTEHRVVFIKDGREADGPPMGLRGPHRRGHALAGEHRRSAVERAVKCAPANSPAGAWDLSIKKAICFACGKASANNPTEIRRPPRLVRHAVSGGVKRLTVQIIAGHCPLGSPRRSSARRP
jgi:hypothetical protein